MGTRSITDVDEPSSKHRRAGQRVYRVDSKTGARQLVVADQLIIEVRPGVEIEIELRPPTAFAGQLSLFCPRRAVAKQQYEAGTADSFAVIFGAENVLHVKVERRTRSTTSMAEQRAAPKSRSRKRTK